MTRSWAVLPPISLSVILLLGGCQGASAPTVEVWRSDVPPALAFFADPPLEHVRISPDGRTLVGITSSRGRRALAVRPVEGGRIRYLGKFESRERRVRLLGWSGERRIVFGLEDPVARGGVGRRLVEVSTFELSRWRPPRDGAIWGLPVSVWGWDAPIVHWLRDDPERVLVSWYDPGEESVRVRRAAVRTGAAADVSTEHPGAREWYADSAGRVRAVVVADREELALRLHARADVDAPFAPLTDEDLARETSLAFAGFAPDPGTLYVYATTEAGRRGVYEYDLARRARGALVAADPRYDAGALIYGPGPDRLWAVEIEGERPRLHFVDEAGAREQASIDATFSGTRNRAVDGDRDAAFSVMELSGDTKPPEYYVFDRDAFVMRFLYSALPALDGVELAPMRPVRFTARDGLEIPAYLTLPPGVEARRLPTIVMPHDGPTARDRWGWDARVQFLVSRGFAVLQPDFRGSGGYGREFERRGYAAWGGAMQDDLADGVAWLVAEGIADPDRVGLFGAGYGGYAALMGPIRDPGVYRAVASWGGISDLLDFYDRPERHDVRDPNSPVAWARKREELAALSPRQRAGEIRVPVLLGHGTADRVVHPSQSEAMAETLEAAGGEVEFLLLRGETHDLRVEEHRLAFYEALAAFFDRHLQPWVAR